MVLKTLSKFQNIIKEKPNYIAFSNERFITANVTKVLDMAESVLKQEIARQQKDKSENTLEYDAIKQMVFKKKPYLYHLLRFENIIEAGKNTKLLREDTYALIKGLIHSKGVILSQIASGVANLVADFQTSIRKKYTTEDKGQDQGKENPLAKDEALKVLAEKQKGDMQEVIKIARSALIDLGFKMESRAVKNDVLIRESIRVQWSRFQKGIDINEKILPTFKKQLRTNENVQRFAHDVLNYFEFTDFMQIQALAIFSMAVVGKIPPGIEKKLPTSYFIVEGEVFTEAIETRSGNYYNLLGQNLAYFLNQVQLQTRISKSNKETEQATTPSNEKPSAPPKNENWWIMVNEVLKEVGLKYKLFTGVKNPIEIRRLG